MFRLRIRSAQHDKVGSVIPSLSKDLLRCFDYAYAPLNMTLRLMTKKRQTKKRFPFYGKTL